MEFPQQFPELTIPTGAGPNDARITINKNQNGAILVYGPGGVLVASIAGTAGVDDQGNAYQAGVTIYGPTTAINFLLNDGTWTAADGSKVVVETGAGASIFLLPQSLLNNPWFDGDIVTTIGGGNHPALSIESPSDQVNAKSSSITLEGSSITDATTKIFSSATFWNHTGTFQINSSDIGSGIQSQQEITANVTGITTTEVTVMTLPSMRFKGGRAYRVHLQGLQQSTTADTYFLHRLRAGTGTAGTIYKDQLRIPTLNAVSVNGEVDLTFLLVNTTGADIVTTTTWTTSCAAGTGILAASAGNHATATIEDVGLASQWPGQPIS